MREYSKMRIARMVVGKSLQDVAKDVGVGASAVAAWENGKSAPSARKIPALAKSLKMSPETVIDLFSA